MRGLVFVSAGLLCSLVVALPAGAAGKDEGSSLTISVLWSVITDRLVKDVAPKNKPSAGDVYWFSASLTNHVPQFGRRSGALVGVEFDTVTVLSRRAQFIRGTATLPGGKLFSSGRVSGRGRVHSLRVIGGSGKYAGARGSVTSEDIGRLASVDNYRVRLP